MRGHECVIFVFGLKLILEAWNIYYSYPSDTQGILDISILEWWGQSNDALTFKLKGSQLTWQRPRVLALRDLGGAKLEENAREGAK